MIGAIERIRPLQRLQPHEPPELVEPVSFDIPLRGGPDPAPWERAWHRHDDDAAAMRAEVVRRVAATYAAARSDA